MKLAVAQPGIPLVLAVLLQSCGGGSSDGDGPGSGSNTRLTISATNVSVAATPGETTPVRTVTLNVTNPRRPDSSWKALIPPWASRRSISSATAPRKGR